MTYKLSTERDERERDRLWYENSIREIEHKVQLEGKRADSLESDQMFLYNKHKETSDALGKAKEDFSKERKEFQDTISQLRTQLNNTESSLDDERSNNRSSLSQLERDLEGLRSQNTTLQSSVDTLTEELDKSSQGLSEKQNTIISLEEQVSSLQSQVMNLKHHEDESESVEIVKRELSQQVKYIQSLEDKIASQDATIKSLNDTKQLVEIVQEEKTSLEAKVQVTEELRQQVGDLELQILKLEQEKQRWSSFLEKDDNFSTPEDVVRALMHERMEKFNLLGKVGRLEAQISSQESATNKEAEELGNLRNEVTDLKSKLDAEAQQSLRLEKQRDLSANECKSLREQLQSYDTEESVMKNNDNPGNNNNNKQERISELEKLVDRYREEINTLTQKLKEKEGEVVNLNSPLRRRRPRSSIGGDGDGDSDEKQERLSEAQRKIRNLQVELENIQASRAEKDKEIGIYKQQITNLEQAGTKKQRILELRENPTAKHEAIKVTQLNALKKENEDLLAQRENNSQVVPISSLERVREDIKDLERQVKDQKKSKERLSGVYQKLSADLRQSVYSLLGYQVDPQPNKKVRVKSIFSHSDEETLTFVPDPSHKGKFVGIDDDSPLTKEYENLITFWVKERKDIPCFLAALNLELYDKTTKAAQF